ncbi:MAG: phasin family protein [Tepidanaerobacteraceae bacterium]|nr:phasin family protein [Tepidanaerobacteraceae bacterium]
MKSVFKELLYAGIGLATLTKEKAEEIVTELIKKGELSKDDGKDALNNLMIRMQEEKDKLKQRIQEQVENAISSMNIVRKSDLDELKKRLEILEEKVNKIIQEKEV